MNTFGNFSQQWNGADTCSSFERMLLPMPSDLVHIEKFAINVLQGLQGKSEYTISKKSAFCF